MIIIFYTQFGFGIILLVVYVNVIVIIESDSVGIQSLKTFLTSKFHIKDLGNLKYFLKVKVSQSRKGIFLSLRKYVLDLLTETGLVLWFLM